MNSSSPTLPPLITSTTIFVNNSPPSFHPEGGFSHSTKDVLQSTSTAFALVASFFAPTAGLDIARGVALFQTASCRSRLGIESTENKARDERNRLNQNSNNYTLASYWGEEIEFPETLLPGVPIRLLSSDDGGGDGLEFVRSTVLSWFFLLVIFTIVHVAVMKLKNYLYIRMNILKPAEVSRNSGDRHHHQSSLNNSSSSIMHGSFPSFVWAACFIFSFAIPNWAFFSGVLIAASIKSSSSSRLVVVDVFVIVILPFVIFFMFQFYYVVYRLRREISTAGRNGGDENDEKASLIISPSSFRAVSSFEKKSRNFLMGQFARFCLVGNFAWSWKTKKKDDEGEEKNTSDDDENELHHHQTNRSQHHHKQERILKAKYLYDALGDVLTTFKGPIQEDHAEATGVTAKSSQQHHHHRPKKTRHFVTLAPHYYFVASVITTAGCLVSGMAAQDDKHCAIALPISIAIAVIDLLFIVVGPPFIVPVQSLISVVVEVCLLVAGIIAIAVAPDDAQLVFVAEVLSLASVWICSLVRTVLICWKSVAIRGIEVVTVDEGKDNIDDDDDDDGKHRKNIYSSRSRNKNLEDFEEEHELHELGHSLLISTSCSAPRRNNHKNNKQSKNQKSQNSNKTRRVFTDDDDDDEEEEENENDPNDLRFSIPLANARRQNNNNNNNNFGDDGSSSSSSESSSRTSTPPRHRRNSPNDSRSNSSNNNNNSSGSPNRNGRRRLVRFVSDEKLDSLVHYYDRNEQESFHEFEDEARKASSPALSHRKFSILDALQTVTSSEI